MFSLALAALGLGDLPPVVFEGALVTRVVVSALSRFADDERPGPRYARDQAAHDARERAYQDSKRELQDAWRTPVAAPLSIEPRATMTDARSVPRTMTMDEAQLIQRSRMAESVNDLEIGLEGPRAMSKPSLETHRRRADGDRHHV